MALVIKGATWLFSETAKRNADRRTDLATIIARQDEEIQALKAEMANYERECNQRIRALEDRTAEAERASARMEGVLYRLGYERTSGGWQRNAGDKE